MKKKKVLLLNSSFYPSIGGVENSLRSLAECLKERGIDVFIVADNKAKKNGRKPPKSETVFGAKVFRYSYLPFFLHFFSSFFLLLNLKRNHNFDIVISRSHITTLIAMLLRFRNLKYIASGVYRFQKASSSHGFLNKIRFKLNKTLEWIVLNNLDRIYVFSENMVKQIKEVNNNANVIKISPGIDIKRFKKFDSSENRKEIGLQGGDILLLFLGRVESVKQPLKTIECLEYLPSNYKLLFVGNGSELNLCKEWVVNLNLTERVIFRGFTDSPEYYYSAADFFLMTSFYESFGQVLLEALASGLPIVAFDPEKTGVNTATKELANIINVDNAFKFASENTSSSLATACLAAHPLTTKDIIKINNELERHWSWFNVFESVDSQYSENK